MFRKSMISSVTVASLFSALGGLSPAMAGSPPPKPDDRLMIVNGNSGRVIYDDGRDDMYCVTRRSTVGYDEYGRRIRRRSMNCR